MKLLSLLLIAAVTVVTLGQQPADANLARGYHRKNGTYVHSYARSTHNHKHHAKTKRSHRRHRRHR